MREDDGGIPRGGVRVGPRDVLLHGEPEAVLLAARPGLVRPDPAREAAGVRGRDGVLPDDPAGVEVFYGVCHGRW